MFATNNNENKIQYVRFNNPVSLSTQSPALNCT